jgi:hypothetical protein
VVVVTDAASESYARFQVLVDGYDDDPHEHEPGRQWRRVASGTEEAKKARRRQRQKARYKANKDRIRARRAGLETLETPEARTRRLALKRKARVRREAAETPKAREERLARKRMKARLRRKLETPDEKIARLTRALADAVADAERESLLRQNQPG